MLKQSADYAAIIKYAKRKYRGIGHFTLCYASLRDYWFALPFDNMEPNDIVIPFIFEGGHWQTVHTKDPGDWQQWVADVYHCSECWGCKQTNFSMFVELMETMMQKDRDDYSPHPSLAAECAAYWNELCAMYPN